MSTWCVEWSDQGRRMDLYLAERFDITRSRAEKLIRAGQVTVDGRVETKPGFALRPGMALIFEVPEPAQCAVAPEPDLTLPIIYQDADLAVVIKPSGMVVHPAAGNPNGTMVNALLAHLTDLSGIGGALRPGIVHRLDKDTSGLLLVAKNDRSHLSLSEQMQARTVERVYLAIVQGRLSQPEGCIERPIGRHPVDRKKMAIVQGGRAAATHYTLHRLLSGASLIEARLTTGRTHQIRVHMASIGHPVLGDPVYGPRKMPHPVEGGQLLHAWRLGFVHPTTGEQMTFQAPPEPRFEAWIERLSQGA